MRRPSILGPLLVLTVAAAPACSKAGMGEGIRTDVTARMESAKDPIQTCYADALQRNRKLRGIITIELKAAPDTGAFTDVHILRDGVGDVALRTCVLAEVAKLKLAQPQKTAVAITYPIDFAPTK